MAKEPASAAPPAPSGEAPAPAKKKSKMTGILIIAGLMAVQGVGIFFVTKTFFGAEPTAAHGEEGEAEHPAAEEHAAPSGHGEPAGHAEKSEHGDRGPSVPLTGDAEIEIADCRPNNRMSGKLISFKLRVSALVAASKAEKAKQLVEANKARINDRVNGVIRSADPKDLNEPGLESIKRRLKTEIARVLGDEQLVQEILIPELLQSGSGL